MAKVICSCVASRLWSIRIGSRRDRETQSRSRECFWHSLEGHGGQAVSKGQERRDSTSERMACQPDVRVRVLLSDIGVELASGSIITVLLNESRPDACVVTGISACSAIADLVPRPLSLLSAAATEEQVIINLVVGCCAVSVKDSGRRSLETDDDGGIGLVGPDMATQAIRLPAKIETSVIRGPNV